MGNALSELFGRGRSGLGRDGVRDEVGEGLGWNGGGLGYLEWSVTVFGGILSDAC